MSYHEIKNFRWRTEKKRQTILFHSKNKFCRRKSLGHVDWSFKDHAETFLARSRKCFDRYPKNVGNKLFRIKNFSSKGYYGHVEGCFYNPVERFSTKGWKILSQWTKTIEGKLFLPTNVPRIVPMEEYKANKATMPKFSCRKPEIFSAMCEKFQRSSDFSNKILRKSST